MIGKRRFARRQGALYAARENAGEAAIERAKEGVK